MTDNSNSAATTSNVRKVPGPKLWLLSLRPFSFTASVMPIALAAVAAVFLQPELPGDLLWVTFPLYAVAGVLFHAGTNVLNDYYDFFHGVDGSDDRDPTHLLPQGLVTPRFMLVSGHIYFALGIALGSMIGLWRGPAYVVTGIVAAILAYFYTGLRFSFKYVALGDIIVFLLMGPAMVAMGVWALAGSIPVEAVLFSLPIAFSVTAILHGNNLRDIDSDRKEGVRTIAEQLGPRYARHVLTLLLALPFLTVAVLVSADVLPLASLLTFIAGVPTAGLLRTVYRHSRSSELVTLPMECAKLHTLFSGLLILSLISVRLMF
ncbi:MAG: prenyltransferase [Spirochaetales bacterium]